MTEPESQDESTTRDVAKLADRFLQQRADERDIAIVERQLGRYPRGMVAVGAVVVNRVRSSRFPNTLAGVIYQSGAFDAVSDGQINLAPSEQSRRAARDALNGWDPTSGCLYYYNPATATSSWIWSREVRLTIGDHSFAV